MVNLRIGSIVIRVEDLKRELRFWTEALGYEPLAAPTEDWVVLRPVEGDGPHLSLDRRQSVLTAPPRLHLDLYTDDQAGEVERLLLLGAALIDWPRPRDADFVTLADPEGNRFDVVQRG